MTRTALLALHIFSVSMWLGANIVQLVLAPWMANRPWPTRADWADAAGHLARRYYNLAGTLVAGSGIALVVHGRWSFSAGFIVVGLAVVAIGGALGPLVFIPSAQAAAAAWRDGDPQRAGAFTNRALRFAVLDTALLVVAILAMVDKWAA